MHLAQIWSSFQDEMVLLSVLSNILVSLEPFPQVILQVLPSQYMAVSQCVWMNHVDALAEIIMSFGCAILKFCCKI